MPQVTQIAEFVKQAAKGAGFDLAGVAPVREFAELEYFPKWVTAGNAGEMHYMQARADNGDLKRASLQNTAPWARSVIVCAMNYNTELPYSTDVQNSDHGWISRYAWGAQDYHEAVLGRLLRVEARLREIAGTESRVPNTECKGEYRESVGPRGPETVSTTVGDFITRCYVDTGPLVERVYAKYAGVGWIGKNTCILNQQLGSWLFLGVILTSLELQPDLPAPDRCGTCTRCIEACPTNAFIAPYQLDSKKCISYLTIEKRGAIPEPLRDGMGHHVFGCDICQDVCPWNRKAPATNTPEFQPRPELVNPALEWLAEMGTEEFRKTFHNSPVRRTKLSGLRRNAVIAMGNSGDEKFIPVLEKLCQDEDPVVAESANWAKEAMEARGQPLRSRRSLGELCG
ncbi:MAG: tRNA epoxyqueuosine(34) reductase QueG [Acidobacteria bacterium]|nr:MAG: tRNA epoxyqueuosine(34) reductase QueG [Acidobacteriota bacterium]